MLSQKFKKKIINQSNIKLSNCCCESRGSNLPRNVKILNEHLRSCCITHSLTHSGFCNGGEECVHVSFWYISISWTKTKQTLCKIERRGEGGRQQGGRTSDIADFKRLSFWDVGIDNILSTGDLTAMLLFPVNQSHSASALRGGW